MRIARAETVLVVEDDQALRESLRDVLDDEGYLVTVAADLASARAQLRSPGVSCVVLDLGLPDGTGAALVRELADQAVAPAVVVMSAALNASEIARHYGVLYLQKPFDIDLVIAAVKVAASQRVRPIAITDDEPPTVRFRRVNGTVSQETT